METLMIILVAFAIFIRFIQGLVTIDLANGNDNNNKKQLNFGNKLFLVQLYCRGLLVFSLMVFTYYPIIYANLFPPERIAVPNEVVFLLFLITVSETVVFFCNFLIYSWLHSRIYSNQKIDGTSTHILLIEFISLSIVYVVLPDLLTKFDIPMPSV